MKLQDKYILILFALIGICLVLAPDSGVLADSVRKPVAAGQFYPDDPARLKEMITDLTRQAEKNLTEAKTEQPVKALVMPHAGYIYSGLTAAHAAPILKDEDFTKIIIMAPDHRVGFSGGAITDAKSYQTPLGRVGIHPDADKLKEKYKYFRTIPASDAREHAVEVILPFLQVWLDDFKIIPIVLGSGDNLQSCISAVETIPDQNTLVIVSTDLSHYLPYEKAVSRDKKTIKIIENLQAEALSADPKRACGHLPLLVLMELAKSRNWNPRLIHYANSGDTAGKRDKVVGYATIAFYGEKKMNKQDTEKQKISNQKGEILLEAARKSIAERLGVSYETSGDLKSMTDDPVFQSMQGTFVTLNLNGQLRGCIGNLMPEKPLIEGVKDNAVNAAFNDPRFAPLSKEEFSRIQIEVSVLTEPKPLEYKDAQDLLDSIRPNVDGLIIRKGAHSSTFLPQVWKQLPDKKSFLRQLCMKAGLAPEEWKKGDIRVFTYQVQYFEEKA
ncbi:MAG: AmmeMemoRadiSam system protein B [Desulfobacteraceae bacterium]|nr:AmmeMemoRadiSam system protein B [Desulfobacteraceae bacterium]